jgi:L-aspartate oxidase
VTHPLVVIGSGVAGLVFALRAAEHRDVLLVTKKDRPESSTNYAQGGIAAALGSDDTPDLHRRDTLAAGAGLCHPGAVDVLVEEGPERVRDLIEIGVRFSEGQGGLSLGREGGHSRRRIVRADDLTGREIERGLLAAVESSSRITVLEDHLAVDLLVTRRGETRRCAGVRVLDPAGELRAVPAAAVLLATGGCGQVYRHTTNPAIATGDGIAMAMRAHVQVANLEFVQFHPTALYPAEGWAFLLTEALRGEGAELVRSDGTPFMTEYHAAGSLAARDIVARAIDREMKRSGDAHVLLDCTRMGEERLRDRFPNIFAETARRGLDITRDPLPVVPAAHYLCGGVCTDLHGRTPLPGLYAAGEVASTGVHGANRLASNSLLEATVFARRAADAALRDAESGAEEGDVEPVEYGSHPPEERAIFVHDRTEIRALMWDLVGIVRTDERLRMAELRLRQLHRQHEMLGARLAPTPESVEVRNLVTVALGIVRCARRRRESRGLHYNVDHPYRDNERFLRDTVLGPEVGVGP